MSTDQRRQQFKRFDKDEIDRGGLEIHYSADVGRLTTSETKHLMNVARRLERRFKQALDADDTNVVATISETNPSARDTVVLYETVPIDKDEPLQIDYDIHRSRLYEIRDGIEAQFHYEYLKLLRNHQ